MLHGFGVETGGGLDLGIKGLGVEGSGFRVYGVYGLGGVRFRGLGVQGL